jgi:hypothetical protein
VKRKIRESGQDITINNKKTPKISSTQVHIVSLVPGSGSGFEILMLDDSKRALLSLASRDPNMVGYTRIGSHLEKLIHVTAVVSYL